eukprot:440345-Hanusia_phi.AAC.1
MASFAFLSDTFERAQASDVLEKCSHDSTLAVRIKVKLSSSSSRPPVSASRSSSYLLLESLTCSLQACFSLANICERAFVIQQLATSVLSLLLVSPSSSFPTPIVVSYSDL